MPRINLLPWREAERKRKRQEFLLSLGAAAATAGLVMLLGHWQMSSPVHREADRNVRAALWLDLPIPGQIMLFVDTGREVLAVAKQEPQVTRLAAAGYDAERIDETLAIFSALDMLYDARQTAHLAAKNATEARNATEANLRTTIRQLRLEVSAVLRANPGVNAPVGF